MQPSGMPTKRKGTAPSLAIAIAALVVAVLSFVVAVFALSRSGGDPVVAAQAPPSSVAAAPPAPSDAPVQPVPSGENSPLDPGELEPSANYQSAYENQKLTVQSGDDNVDIDLDEPRVRPQKGGDVSYSSWGDNSLSFGNSERIAVVASAQASAGDCVEAIRSAAGVTSMAAAADVTVCVLTSRSAASSEGKTQKLVRFHVDSIAKDDDTLTVSLTAWNVP